jgi:tellurium resistance protein TerD
MSDDPNDELYDPQAARKKASGLFETKEINQAKRGDQIDLMRKDPSLKHLMAGVGWDLKSFDRDPPDLDASLFLLDRTERTREDSDFIFYNNQSGCEGAVKHMGDSRTGAGEGDDESMVMDLQALPFDIVKIAFTLSIYDLDMNENNFTHVKNVYFRLVNKETGQEMMRYDLTTELESGGTGLLIGELERIGASWVFHAIGNTIKGGLGRMATNYGIMVSQMIQE